MSGTRGAKRRRTATAARLALQDVALELADGRAISVEEAERRLVDKRLRDSHRHATRVQRG